MPAAKNRVNSDEGAFFKGLGERLMTLRKDRGWTQTQLAKTLGCSQPRIAQIESGSRRIPVSELAVLAETFGVSLDALAGIHLKPSKRGPPPLLQRQLERLAKLPRTQQRVVSEMLEGFLQRAAV